MLAATLDAVTFPPGALILRQGKRPTHVYLFTAGTLLSARGSTPARDVLVGLHSCWAGCGSPRSVLAGSRTDGFVLDGRYVPYLVERNPGLIGVPQI